LLLLMCSIANSHTGKGQESMEKLIRQNAFERDRFYYDEFPENFGWGTATAAYQIEGGWNAAGKGESVWDDFTHRMPCWFLRNQTGDVTCDSYHKFDDDLAIIKELGLSHYRFSISWSRIFPDGKNTSGPLPDGVRYYNEVINKLLAANVEPMVTLFHWDLPQALQDEFGGFNSSEVVPHFLNYADFCFRTFGDRVKYWFTFNEPYSYCMLGHGLGVSAPGKCVDWLNLSNNFGDRGEGVYYAAHSIIKSHAQAYHIYNNTYRQTQQGQIGITLNTNWVEPSEATDLDHIEASQRSLAFSTGWFAEPIFNSGDYPDVMRWNVGNRSEYYNVNPDRLPKFTKKEKELNKATSDFFGLNHYTSNLIVPCSYYPVDGPTYDSDQVSLSSEKGIFAFLTHKGLSIQWPGSASSWLYQVPWGIRKLLIWIKRTYGDPVVYITENGISEHDYDGLEDDIRVNYYKDYIDEVLKAINEDDVKVKGYTAWSLMDNFEWAEGYSERFGLHWVNFTDPERPRIPKKSASYYKSLAESG
uniref:beta-glucosidase n=1 Tax=Ciona intestinalis TaxID=7719 RepID=H2Y3C5_CIOIN